MSCDVTRTANLFTALIVQEYRRGNRAKFSAKLHDLWRTQPWLAFNRRHPRHVRSRKVARHGRKIIVGINLKRLFALNGRKAILSPILQAKAEHAKSKKKHKTTNRFHLALAQSIFLRRSFLVPDTINKMHAEFIISTQIISNGNSVHWRMSCSK